MTHAGLMSPYAIQTEIAKREKQLEEAQRYGRAAHALAHTKRLAELREQHARNEALARSETARMREASEARSPGSQAKELSAEDDAPPTAIDYACPECGAQAGQACRNYKGQRCGTHTRRDPRRPQLAPPPPADIAPSRDFAAPARAAAEAMIRQYGPTSAVRALHTAIMAAAPATANGAMDVADGVRLNTMLARVDRQAQEGRA